MPPVKDPRAPDVPLSAITRREFLQVGGAASLALFPGCNWHPGGEHPDGVRPPGGPESHGTAACSLCASGCAVRVRVVGGRAVGVSGLADHPVNGGALCARGAAATQHLYDLDRLVGPVRRSNGSLARVSWDEALDEAASRLTGGSLVVVDGLRGCEADLCARFAEAAGGQHVRADSLRRWHDGIVGGPLAWDYRNTRLVMLFGCEWLEDAPDPMAALRAHAHLRQGRSHGRGKVVLVGTRFSSSAGRADEFVPVRQGTEGGLALGMANVLLRENLAKSAPPEAFRALCERHSPERTARLTGLEAGTVVRLAQEFAALAPQVAIGWRGLRDQSNGDDSLRAVHALNALAGSLGAPGGLGAVASPPLAAWEEVPTPAARPESARRVLITTGGNPVFTDPERLRETGGVDYHIAIGPLLDETAQAADLVLPTPTFLERFDVDVPAVGFPTVTVTRPGIEPLHDTRPAGDILLAIAHRSPALRGAFRWESYREAVRERLFGLFLAERGSIREDKWERFQERLEEAGGWWDTEAPRPSTPAPSWPERWEPPRLAGEGSVLLTFASAVLGEGEGASLPWLQERAGWQHGIGWDSWIEMNPAHGFRTGQPVIVRSPSGALRTRVVATPSCPPDVVAMPLGQGHTASGRWAEGRGADPRRLGRAVRVTVERA